MLAKQCNLHVIEICRIIFILVNSKTSSYPDLIFLTYRISVGYFGLYNVQNMFIGWLTERAEN